MYNRRQLLALLGSGTATLALGNCSTESKATTSVLKATIRLEPDRFAGLVNRRVLGGCLMYPPFADITAAITSTIGGKTSTRIWPGQLLDQEWQAKIPGLKAISPCLTLSFQERVWHPDKKVFYRSEQDNNLYAHQQPAYMPGVLSWMLDRIRGNNIKLEGNVLYWEAWNEPQFEQNGAWEPADMARYVNDVARTLRSAKLAVKVGAALHMDNHAWNQQMCRRLDRSQVDFLANHYYSFWHQLRSPDREFLRRAGLASLLRDRLERDRSLLQYGHGRWTLHGTEWGLHPPNYQPPYYTTRDMAAALYAFSAIKLYLEQGLTSAQFFLLSGTEHFGALSRDAKGNVTVHPTGAVLALLNRCLYGQRLQVSVQSPTYALGERTLKAIPYIEAIACKWQDGNIRLLIANKDPDRAASIQLQGRSLPNQVEIELVSSASSDREKATLRVTRQTLATNKQIIIPAAAIAALKWS